MFYEVETYNEDGELIVVIEDENGNEVNSFKDGDVLILLNMPYDFFDHNNQWHHATGRAIWSSTRYLHGGWENEYED